MHYVRGQLKGKKCYWFTVLSYNAYLNEDSILIDDPLYGAKLIREDATRITEFTVCQKQQKVRMRGVFFYCDSENGKIIAIGSDHGVVYLYHLSGGVEALKVGEHDDWIQIVKVSGQFRGFPISAKAK